jgi:glycosyl-4,4'-diaponeurosporenoate acyltransferase
MKDIFKFIILNTGTWVFWFYIIGFFASKLNNSFLEKDYILTRLFRFEKDASWFRKYLKIDKWKDKVPELGGFFKEGFQKRSISFGEKNQLLTFVRETRRAELAHWLMTSGWILTILFNPLWAIIFNLIFAHLVNFPCLVIQRYNRARLLKVLETKY